MTKIYALQQKKLYTQAALILKACWEPVCRKQAQTTLFHVQLLTCSAGFHFRNWIPWHNKGPINLEQSSLTKPSVHVSKLSHMNFLNEHAVPDYTSLNPHPRDKKLLQ